MRLCIIPSASIAPPLDGRLGASRVAGYGAIRELAFGYPVKTGFGVQIVKCATLVTVLPRVSVSLTVSVYSPGRRPRVFTLTLKLALVGFPANFFDLIVLLPWRTVTLLIPAIARSEIGNETVVPESLHATIDLAITVGDTQGGL
jgi:hypothetical protein